MDELLIHGWFGWPLLFMGCPWGLKKMLGRILPVHNDDFRNSGKAPSLINECELIFHVYLLGLTREVAWYNAKATDFEVNPGF